MEPIYSTNLVEVEQQHKAFLVLVSPLQCCFVFVLSLGCNLGVAALPKKPVCMHRDHMCRAALPVVSAHSLEQSRQSREGTGRNGAGVELEFHYMSTVEPSSS